MTRTSTPPVPSTSGAAKQIDRRAFLSAAMCLLPLPAFAQTSPIFKRVKTQYIAAIVSPEATSGTDAQNWGMWIKDPGPRGVWFQQFDELMAADGRAPANWVFDRTDWWLDENGLLMERPTFPISPGKYVVTGNREKAAILTVYPKGADGKMKWDLNNGATIHDVTHLRCRAARYTPDALESTCTPKNVPRDAFPMKIGNPMPQISDCKQVDYTVLFIVGVAVG